LDWSRVSQGREAERKSIKWGMHKGTIRAVRQYTSSPTRTFFLYLWGGPVPALVSNLVHIYMHLKAGKRYACTRCRLRTFCKLGEPNYLKEASLDDRLSPINRACDWPSLVFDDIARPKIPPSECDLYVARKTCGNATPV
jgi:hypothetical protein